MFAIRHESDKLIVVFLVLFLKPFKLHNVLQHIQRKGRLWGGTSGINKFK